MNFDYLYYFAGVVVWCFILSIIAFFRYKADKEYAVNHEWRIPEKELLSIGALGGCYGAYMSMQKYRHKTKHWYFTFVNVAGMVFWTLVMIALLCFWIVM